MEITHFLWMCTVNFSSQRESALPPTLSVIGIPKRS